MDRLADAIVKTYAIVTLGLIDIPEPKVIQFYPNFQTQTWEYLFIPSGAAFGKFVDCYYSFATSQIHYFNTTEEFIRKFPINDYDEYKFIIFPKAN